MKSVKYAILIFVALFIISCGQSPGNNVLRIGYSEFSFDQAVVFVLKGILDQQPNVQVELYRVPDSTMFRALAANELDVGISAWTPNTHQRFFDMYPYEILRHSMICDSLGLYLAVPGFSTLETIDDLATAGDLYRNTILMPESRNAIFHAGSNVIEDYGLNAFSFRESSWDNIVSFVEESVGNNNHFVFVGMRPHWVFQRHNLRPLEDTKRSLGDFEQAHIVVNAQFPERMPAIANFLSRVRFNLRDIENLMEMNQELGSEPYENAIRWINQNTNRINRWLM